MVEVDNEIAVVGGHGVTENYSSDAAPIFERAPLKNRQPAGCALVGHVDVKTQRALRRWIALVENLGQDLVAKIQRLALDPRLVRRNQQAHKLRRSCGIALRLAELGDLIKLALR